MFNKSSFNRNAFNRDVSSASFSASMIGTGSLKSQLVIRFIPTVRSIAGSSSMKCGLILRQYLDLPFAGSGEMANDSTVLNMAIRPIKLSGSGTIIPRPSIHTPIRCNLSGGGTVKTEDRFHLLQYMSFTMASQGSLRTGIELHHPIPINLAGSSTFKGLVALPAPLFVNLYGAGDLGLRRLSAVNENILELIDINLLPGETVVIDTDLLQVLFGMVEDVSSVTSDSIFFELSPGDNEITISTDSDTKLEVTAIWQNRWL